MMHSSQNVGHWSFGGTVPPGPVDIPEEGGRHSRWQGQVYSKLSQMQVCPLELSFSGGVPSASVHADAWLGSCPALPLKGVLCTRRPRRDSGE